jgi:hypothetical protein
MHRITSESRSACMCTIPRIHTIPSLRATTRVTDVKDVRHDLGPIRVISVQPGTHLHPASAPGRRKSKKKKASASQQIPKPRNMCVSGCASHSHRSSKVSSCIESSRLMDVMKGEGSFSTLLSDMNGRNPTSNLNQGASLSDLARTGSIWWLFPASNGEGFQEVLRLRRSLDGSGAQNFVCNGRQVLSLVRP